MSNVVGSGSVSSNNSRAVGILVAAGFQWYSLRAIVVLRQYQKDVAKQQAPKPFDRIQLHINSHWGKDWSVKQVTMAYLALRREHFAAEPTPLDNPFCQVVEDLDLPALKAHSAHWREEYQTIFRTYYERMKQYRESNDNKPLEIQPFWENLASRNDPPLTPPSDLFTGVTRSWLEITNLADRSTTNKVLGRVR
ncbi:MAG: hypothetical protein Q9212_007184 [Teloschistes hypoglaucus]